MTTTAYRLPDLSIFLPQKPSGQVSPHFREAETGFNVWAKEKFGTQYSTVLQRANVPHFVALTWPLASCQQLRGIVDYMTAAYILEVWTDNASSTDATTLAETWIKILSSSGELQRESSIHPFFKVMLSELVPSMKAVVGPYHWQRFVDECKSYAMSMIQEALDREEHTAKEVARGIQSYALTRRESCAVRPCLTLMRSTRGLSLPDDVLDHPVIQEMEVSVLDMFWTVNDIYSFKAEYSVDGAVNNSLTAMQTDPATRGLDLQGRLDYVEKLFREALERFSTSKKNLPGVGQGLDQQLAIYADSMMDFVVGNLEWSAITPRYRVFMNDEDKKNMILRLDSALSL
ncbi:isoprenoid synthase domain-containing protein [Chiua virens]|nr:isoprenoid synthase domain-containing protein [Chiua virens]